MMQNAMRSPQGAASDWAFMNYQGNPFGKSLPTVSLHDYLKTWDYWRQRGVVNPGALLGGGTTTGNVRASGVPMVHNFAAGGVVGQPQAGQSNDPAQQPWNYSFTKPPPGWSYNQGAFQRTPQTDPNAWNYSYANAPAGWQHTEGTPGFQRVPGAPPQMTQQPAVAPNHPAANKTGGPQPMPSQQPLGEPPGSYYTSLPPVPYQPPMPSMPSGLAQSLPAQWMPYQGYPSTPYQAYPGFGPYQAYPGFGYYQGGGIAGMVPMMAGPGQEAVRGYDRRKPSTDSVPAMLTPGEMVLTRPQQAAVRPIAGKAHMLRPEQRAAFKTAKGGF